VYLLQYAFSVLVQRASASDKSDEDKAASEDKKAKQIAAGETPSSRGPRGPRLGFAALAEREVMMELLVGLCGLAKGKAAEALKSIDESWETITRAVIIAQLQGAGKDPKKENIKGLVNANIDAVRDNFTGQIDSRAKALEEAHKAEQERAAKAKQACLSIGGLKL